MWMNHKVLLWLLGGQWQTHSASDSTAHWTILCAVGDTGSSMLCWFVQLASDTPVVQSCQSVSRQSEEPRQYILCSPNTVNTEYISAPNTHVWHARSLHTNIFNKHKILVSADSRWIQFQNLGCCILLYSEQCPHLNWILKWASSPSLMTWPTLKISLLDLWIVRKSTCLQFYDHHFSQSGRSVTPFQPSWEC